MVTSVVYSNSNSNSNSDSNSDSNSHSNCRTGAARQMPVNVDVEGAVFFWPASVLVLVVEAVL